MLVDSLFTPRVWPSAPPTVNEMVWLALAPTWKACEVNEPSSSCKPLKVVLLAMRFSSDTSWFTSDCRLARLSAELVELADWIDNSRTRWRILVLSCSAPSAVCDSEMPSLALRMAWARPRIWEVIWLEMARPAASSFALLMRKPEDRRSIEVCIELWVMLN